jgi:hypothetical protein
MCVHIWGCTYLFNESSETKSGDVYVYFASVFFNTFLYFIGHDV